MALLAVLGDSQAWSQSLFNSDGTPYTGFTSAATFAVSLWSGARTLPISPGLSAAWISAPAGTYLLRCPGSSSAGLIAGTYRVLVEITFNGITGTAFDGSIEFRGRPGTAAIPTSYTSFEVMLELYPMLASLNSSVGDQTGFAQQQHQAKADFDLFLIERYNPQPGFTRRRTPGVFDPSAGFDVPDSVTLAPTPAQLRTALAIGGLVLTEPDSTYVSEINARLAIARVLDRQVGGGDRRSNPYAADAEMMRQAAMQMMARYRAFIDLTGGQTPSVLIDRDCIFLT